MEWAEFTFPSHFKYFHHSPNGGLRERKIASKLKAMGTKAGFPDILYPSRRIRPKLEIITTENGKIYNHIYMGMAMEYKSKRANNPSASIKQKEWIQFFKENGWYADIIFGYDEAKKFISTYMNLSEI